jgi:hypothetical protein
LKETAHFVENFGILANAQINLEAIGYRLEAIFDEQEIKL